MSKSLADRVVGLKPSATVEMTERVRAARASGRKIIGLSSGDPNIDTDPRIIAAAEGAMRQGETRYGAPAGSLRYARPSFLENWLDLESRTTPPT
jgi:aspartate/methionine/tyrosine aminotransferase